MWRCVENRCVGCTNQWQFTNNFFPFSSNLFIMMFSLHSFSHLWFSSKSRYGMVSRFTVGRRSVSLRFNLSNCVTRKNNLILNIGWRMRDVTAVHIYWWCILEKVTDLFIPLVFEHSVEIFDNFYFRLKMRSPINFDLWRFIDSS